MEIEKAKEIVLSLASGVDPVSGEIFQEDSPYNHPTVIRALYTILNYVRIPKRQNKLSAEEKQAQNIATGKPRNAGLAWTEDLKTEVASLFKKGKTIQELANYFERTEGAIVSELTHQGIIDRNEAK